MSKSEVGYAACRVPLTHPRVSFRDDTSDGRSCQSPCKVQRCILDNHLYF